VRAELKPMPRDLLELLENSSMSKGCHRCVIQNTLFTAPVGFFQPEGVKITDCNSMGVDIPIFL